MTEENEIFSDPVPVGEGRAPGGVWFRLRSDRELLTEYALERSFEPAVVSARVYAELMNRSLDDDETLWLDFYDGNSGRCVVTVLTTVGEQLG